MQHDHVLEGGGEALGSRVFVAGPDGVVAPAVPVVRPGPQQVLAVFIMWETGR
jgi:hypothetical protein